MGNSVLSALLAALLLAGQAGAGLQCLYYERDAFLDATAAPALYEAPSAPVAGVVPHHLVASDMIAGFFRMAGAYTEEYDAVLLVSPMHFPEDCGGARVVTSSRGWAAPAGEVPVAAPLANGLLSSGDIGAADLPAASERDHGIAGLVPFIAHYLPGVPVLPVLLRHDLPQGQFEALARYVGGLGQRVLVVVSVDFSHYLNPAAAALRDEESAAALAALDEEAVARFTDANVDSPHALRIFLRLCDGYGAGPVQLDHSSSAQKLPQSGASTAYAEGVTSYFIYAAFAEGAEPA